MNNELLAHCVFLYAINLMLTILNLLIMIKISILKCRPTGYPWVPINPMGMGLDKILNPSWVWIFLMGLDIFYEFGFGMAKQDGFIPVAIAIP